MDRRRTRRTWSRSTTGRIGLTATPLENGSSKIFFPGGTGSKEFAFTFDEPGEYAFSCALIHPQMAGVIRVRERSSPPVDPPQEEVSPQVKVKPRMPKAKAKATRKLTLEATVRNRGDGAAEDLSVCVSARRKLIRVLRDACSSFGSLAPGESERVSFRLRPTKRARGKRVPVTVTTSGSNLATTQVVKRLAVAKSGG